MTDAANSAAGKAGRASGLQAGDGSDSSFTVGQFYRQSPDQVWQVLTSREFLVDWFVDRDTTPVVVGRAFPIKTFPVPGTDYSGQMDSVFTKVVPAEVMAHRATTVGRSPWTFDISWTLHPESGGTRVLYVHSGFDPRREGHELLRTVMRTWALAALQHIESLLSEAND